MSKKEELSEQYRRKAYEVSPTRKRCQHNNEVIAWNNEIVGAFEAGYDAACSEVGGKKYNCGKILNLRRKAYAKGKEDFLDKACEWLENNLVRETSIITGGYAHINFGSAIKKFRKAMEG